MNISSTTYAQNKVDSVKVAISDIRKANLVFVNYDTTLKELDYCKQITTISAKQLLVKDSIVYKLEQKITNLDLIIVNKDKIHDDDLALVNKKFKKFKRNTFIAGGSTLGLLILIIAL